MGFGARGLGCVVSLPLPWCSPLSNRRERRRVPDIGRMKLAGRDAVGDHSRGYAGDAVYARLADIPILLHAGGDHLM